jgi:tetratricopeptide (TPR) repeat protein
MEVTSNKKRDIDALIKSVENNPDNKENVLLLANMMFDCGFYSQAIKWYDERIKMDTMDVEEVWLSMFRKGLCKIRDKHSFKSITDDLMNAFNARPWRLEPIYYLVKYLREQGNVTTAYWIGRMCAVVQNPISDKLFIEKDIYDWKFWSEMRLCSWFSGQRDDSKEYYDRCMKHDFNEEDREIVKNNLKLN